MSNKPLGLAGRIAGAFSNSKLTPLFVGAAILLGIGAVMLLPREEEPQIIVPMIDVMVQMPGASAKEIEEDRRHVAAGRGDRRRVDVMISDVYPEGIGRVGPNLTAAHLARAGAGSLDDFLAGLLNLHGENIAQIAAGRAQAVRMSRVVLAGGFAHGNPSLVASITGMAALFGLSVETAPWPAYAGALGAALAATESGTEAAS